MNSRVADHDVEAPRRVVVAGHKLDFLAPVIGRLRDAGHVVELDRWDGHAKHDEARSSELVGWADVVICEFCLGNAVWYAAHKRAEQRLLVHFHRFEIGKRYPEELEIDPVDHVVFAGPHFLREVEGRFGWPDERCVFVPNPIDVDRFDLPKRAEARWTLGLLGYDRRLKRLDLALDVLEALRAEDDRYRLLVKGEDPAATWVWKHEDERGFFEEQYARIEGSDRLRGAVRFAPFADDVEEWFREVGYVLSTSDVESFHLAAVEGMASRATPVIRRWEGAAEIYPERWLHADPSEMAAAILSSASGTRWEDEGEDARRFVASTYGLDLVALAWRGLVLGLPPTELPGSTAHLSRASTSGE